MKNVTLSLDEETYRRARVVAALRNQSVSALVRDYLRSLSAGAAGAEARTAPELRRFFGSLAHDDKGSDNEGIDADLARAYANEP